MNSHPHSSPPPHDPHQPSAAPYVTRPITRELLEEIIAMGRRDAAASPDAVDPAAAAPQGDFTTCPSAPPAPQKERQWGQIWKPSDFAAFTPPADFVLAGDTHFTRGGITVLGGWPGVGKSRAALGLAIAGATGRPWLGHAVHARFRTLILQVENGQWRLKQELAEALPAGVSMDDWLRISPPLPYGLAFQEAGFRLWIQQVVRDFQPGLIIVDPWNRVAESDRQSDYRQALDCILECLPPEPHLRPAVLILHHLRKKTGAEGSARKQGRELLHELAGSYQIGSAARCVFILEPGSRDTTDPTVVLTCCKNNDGREGRPTAWTRSNGLFEAAPEFDMDGYLKGEEKVRSLGAADPRIATALRGMMGEAKGRAAARLVSAGICERTEAYEILATHPNVEEDNTRLLWWREDE